MRAAVAVLCLAAAAVATSDLVEIAKVVNNMHTTWVASPDAMGKTSRRYGHIKSTNPLPRRTYSEAFIKSLPSSFDVRDKWPNCPTMKEIRDQGNCGSCWAISSAEVMSDRECVFNNRTVRISTEDINSCANCGSCDGGEESCAMNFWVKKGVVSENCVPYSIPGCDHHIPNSKNPCDANKDLPTPSCKKACNSNTTIIFSADKHKASRAYSVSGEQDIMADVYKSGSVVTAFTVYADFESYVSGIYQHVTGKNLGGHAVKIIGWGEENGTKYWIIANSWNPSWGEKGTFRILKGANHCGIEDEANAGEPVLAK